MIIEYNDEHTALWDSFCDGSYQGTFLQTRKFLSYHGDRFNDRSLLIFEKDKLVGVFAAACVQDECNKVISHPGTSFGGIITNGNLKGQKLLDTYKEILRIYQNQGVRELIVKTVPRVFQSMPCEDEKYALFRLNAIQFRCDLGSVVEMRRPRELSKRRIRSLKKAQNYGFQLSAELKYLSEFWKILTDNLRENHGVSPVHTYEEIRELFSRFPENIGLLIALDRAHVCAGIISFKLNKVYHTQYVATNRIAKDNSALDLIYDHVFNGPRSSEYEYVSFGISTTDDGHHLNSGLYSFKSEFGALGCTYDHYKIFL